MSNYIAGILARLHANRKSLVDMLIDVVAINRISKASSNGERESIERCVSFLVKL